MTKLFLGSITFTPKHLPQTNDGMEHHSVSCHKVSSESVIATGCVLSEYTVMEPSCGTWKAPGDRSSFRLHPIRLKKCTCTGHLYYGEAIRVREAHMVVVCGM